MPHSYRSAPDAAVGQDGGQPALAWIRQRVLQAIADEVRQPLEAIGEGIAIDELGFDSLNVSTNIQQLEKTFSIEIAAEDLVWFHEVQFVGGLIPVVITILRSKGYLETRV